MAHVQESLIILVASVTGAGGSVTVTGLDATTPYYLPNVTPGNTFFYSIPTDAAGNWEYGLGTWTATGNGTTTFGSFARTTPIRSSAGVGVPAAFSGNPVSLLFDVPAEKQLFLGPSNEIINGAAIANAVNVLNFETLRDLPVGTINNIIYNVGYGRAEGDGLGGAFLLKLGDVTPADDIDTDTDVNTIAPAVGNARYLRIRSAFQPPNVAAVSNLSTGSMARLTATKGLITNHEDRGQAIIPEVETHFQGVFATYAQFEALASTKWKDGDEFWFYGKLTAGDCRPHSFTWAASNTNTTELGSLSLRPTDITGSNPGRAIRNEPGPILKFTDGVGAPSVIGSEFFRASDAGTAITSLTGAIDLVQYVIFPGAAATTLTHSAAFVMPNEEDFVLETTAGGGAPVTIIYENGVGYLSGGGGSGVNIESESNQASAADLASDASSANTSRKRLGRIILETTNLRTYFSTGPLPTDPWRPLDDQSGLSDITPS